MALILSGRRCASMRATRAYFGSWFLPGEVKQDIVAGKAGVSVYDGLK